MNKKAVWAAVLVAALAVTGCKSILLDARLVDNPIDMVKPAEPVPVPDGGASGEEEAMLQSVVGDDKYRIGGLDAFYILPSHRPAPDTMVDFQVLDLIDGHITVYAYQAVTAAPLPDWKGVPWGGTAENTDNYTTGDGVTHIDRSKYQLAETVLMCYDTDTGEYVVFYHGKGPNDQNVSSTWQEDGSGRKEDGGDETGSFFVQVTGGDQNQYFLYHQGVGRVFDRKGQCIYTKDIQVILDRNRQAYGGEGATMTISNVVMDQNLFMYVLMDIERSGTSVDENTSEEELEDQEDSGIVQLLYSCFSLDVGEPVRENLTEEEKRYFLSRNLNYEEQVKQWKESALDEEGSPVIIDLDVDHEPGEEEIRQAADQVLASAGRLRTEGDTRDLYETYHYIRPEFPVELRYYAGNRANSWWDRWREEPEALTPLNFSQYESLGRILFGGHWGSLVGYGTGQMGGTMCFFDSYVFLSPQTCNQVSHDRTFIVRWEEEEETGETDENGEPVTETVEYQKEITETALFIQSYEARFRGRAVLDWSENRYTSDMIVPSAGTGVIRYNSRGGSDGKDYSFIDWSLASGRFWVSGIPGTAQNMLLKMCQNPATGKKEPYLMLFTSDSLHIFWDFSSNHRDIFFWIPRQGSASCILSNGALSFSKEGALDPDGGLGAQDSGDQWDGGTSMNMGEKAVTDVYSDAGLAMWYQGGRRWLYLAGTSNGLIQCCLDAGSQSPIRSGQVSPYPCFGVWVYPETGSRLCHVIGFPTGEYAYDLRDISCAKLYTLDPESREAALSLVGSAMEASPQVKKQILEGDSGAWSQMLNNLKLSGTGMESYQSFLLEGQNRKQKAVIDFYNLAGIREKDRNEDTRAQIEECLYVSDLEGLMARLRPDLIGLDQVKEPELKGETGKIDYAGDPSMEYGSGDDGEMQQAVKDQQQVLESQTQIRRIVELLKQQAGLSDEKWTRALEEIIRTLHEPETLER